MNFFVRKNKKTNLFQGIRSDTNQEPTAGFIGGSKFILLASSALVVVCLLSAVMNVSSQIDSNAGMQYSDIAVLASEKLASEDFGEAIELYEQAIKINPMDEELYIGLSDSYKGANNDVKAREILETGYSETKSGNIKVKLDELQETELHTDFNDLMNAGRTALKDKNYQLAYDSFVGAIELDPESVEAYLMAADSCIEKEEAIGILQKGYDLTENTAIKERLDKLKSEAEEELSKAESGGEASKKEESGTELSDIRTVEVKTYTEQNSYSYKDTIIFESSASWFEISGDEGNNGLRKINDSISDILSRYFKYNPSVYGAETDEDIYNYVSKSGKPVKTDISILPTYNGNDIVSYTVSIDVTAPENLSSLELHTLNIKTGEELSLGDILSGSEGNIEKIVTSAYDKVGIKLSESEFENTRFYLESDRLVLVSSLGRTYISYSDTDKFKVSLFTTETSKAN